MSENVSAKSVILELLSAGPAVYSGSIPVRLLVRAATVFGVAENSVRVAIVRLRAEGLVDSPERGRYALGPAAQPINKQISRWRSLEDQVITWDGSWAASMTAHLSRTDRPALRKRSQALRLLGMRELQSGLFVRPNNLAIGVEGIRQWLQRLGMEEQALICRLDELPETEVEKAKSLWDVSAMHAVYRDMHEQLTESLERLDNMPPENAVREAFLLGREGIRWLVLDPLLPEPMVSQQARDELVAILKQHVEKGYDLWRNFLALENA